MVPTREAVAQDRETSRILYRLMLVIGVAGVVTLLARVLLMPAPDRLFRWVGGLEEAVLWGAVAWAGIRFGPPTGSVSSLRLQRSSVALAIACVGTSLVAAQLPVPSGPPSALRLGLDLVTLVASVLGLLLLAGVLVRDGAGPLARSAKLAAAATVLFWVLQSIVSFPDVISPGLGGLSVAILWALVGEVIALWPVMLLWRFSAGYARLPVYQLLLASLAVSAVSSGAFFMSFSAHSPVERMASVPVESPQRR